MDEILKPCPICGYTASIDSWWDSKEECGIASIGCGKQSYVNGYECVRMYVMRCDERTARNDAIILWNTRAERTCRNDMRHDDKFVCSECGCHVRETQFGYSYTETNGKRWFSTSNEHHLRYCPNCGARMDGDENG